MVESAFGRVLLGFIAFVLFGHLVWRLFETYFDPYDKGTTIGGLIYRMTYLLSAVSYGSLAMTALALLIKHEAGSDHGKQIWVADMLEKPGGVWLVGLIGLIVAIWGLVQGYKGVSGGVVESLEIDHLPEAVRRLIWASSFIGFLALGIILVGTGFYLIKGAVLADSHTVKNMNDVLHVIEDLPGGRIWLRVEAVGLFVFGIFMLLMARYFPFKAA